MALCHFPSFFTPPLHKFNNPPLKWGTHHYPFLKNLSFACSAEKARKKGKSSKPTKSNEDLFNELREFVSAAGLPQDHVPSMKELSDNGRKDLANIVRRRGYKMITELLKNSFKNDIDTEKPLEGDQSFSNASSNEASEVQERILIESAESISSPCEKYMITTNGAIPTDTLVEISESSESSASSLHSRATNFVQTGKLDIFEDYVHSQEAPLSAPWTDRDQTLSKGLEGTDDDENSNSEMDREKINQAEIDRLKAMLSQKEMELLELKQQIEMEKQSLCTLQEKANEEVGNAHKTASEKDMEVRATEESLYGLREVQIEYWGNGEIVELAGSFNGWHNRIKMDLHPSPKLLDPPCSRNLELWSTILWLYPGNYEIKFIVDGIWRIDTNRETTTSCNITNNILRVDR